MRDKILFVLCVLLGALFFFEDCLYTIDMIGLDAFEFSVIITGASLVLVAVCYLVTSWRKRKGER